MSSHVDNLNKPAQAFSQVAMPFSVEVDRIRQLVLLRPDRAPTVQDWADAIDRAISDPQFEPGFNFVSDRRHLSEPPPKEYVRGSIEALAARRHQLGDYRVAVVTAHQATFGMARMAEAHAEGRQVQFRVFRDYDAAARWATTGEE